MIRVRTRIELTAVELFWMSMYCYRLTQSGKLMVMRYARLVGVVECHIGRDLRLGRKSGTLLFLSRD
ncbi:hypothetical protein EBAPG3_001755 [Nitrosospira lacus]|uniref:Uncharacterized protein n=1 Tax=Nitrosospira lacus TaxID=1288494 RepID=A0A1W6SLB7_9PROT|nr:hypothetical protein EBAPG3_001755 [Nitrosospira lacus]